MISVPFRSGITDRLIAPAVVSLHGGALLPTELFHGRTVADLYFGGARYRNDLFWAMVFSGQVVLLLSCVPNLQHGPS